MRNRQVVCILDNNRERCLREEKALDEAIAAKKLPVSGMANFGPNYLARTGVESFPAVEVEGLYFTPKKGCKELDYAMLCDLLDMLVAKGLVTVESEERPTGG